MVINRFLSQLSATNGGGSAVRGPRRYVVEDSRHKRLSAANTLYFAASSCRVGIGDFNGIASTFFTLQCNQECETHQLSQNYYNIATSKFSNALSSASSNFWTKFWVLLICHQSWLFFTLYLAHYLRIRIPHCYQHSFADYLFIFSWSASQKERSSLVIFPLFNKVQIAVSSMEPG